MSFNYRFFTTIAYLQSALKLSSSQYSKSSPGFDQLNSFGLEHLDNLLGSRPDSLPIIYPEKVLIPKDQYVNDFPSPVNYRIEMLMDPCRGLQPDCCMNVFGTAEYSSLIKSNAELERYVPVDVIGTVNEVQVNYERVYEDGSSVSSSSSRYPDDELIFDTNCIAKNNPYTYCGGKNQAYVKSKLRPPCSDNNSTLDSLAGCTYPNGTTSVKCTQIAYNQNAYIAQCSPDYNRSFCGTYVEIHVPFGTLYHSEVTVFSEVLIDTFNVSGSYTTVIPLTVLNDPKRVLCAYQEEYFRVGSTVYILPTSPTCCCPKVYFAGTQLGSFFCPKGTTGTGPFATVPQTLTDILAADADLDNYPFCLTTYRSSNDSVLMADFDAEEQRNYVRYASAVNINQNISSPLYGYASSVDLIGKQYTDICPYFGSCAMALDGAKCLDSDASFSFEGHVGIVTEVVDSVQAPAVWVTFNGGRSAYFFRQEYVRLEFKQKSMYELWWVIRNKSDRRLQKRKGFNVTSPACTFDLTNNRYFPFAMLDDNGMPLNSSYNIYA